MANIRDLLAGGPTLSFEFFPPKTDVGLRALEKTLHELEEVRPDFVSMTYGAGGSTRELTRDLVVDINRMRSYPAMAHLTCMGHTEAELRELLEDYLAQDVTNILALAGDPPTDGTSPLGDFTWASELVDFARNIGDFSLAVAAFPELHPRSEMTDDDRHFLAAKLNAADFAITQFFFDPVVYLRLRDDLAKLGCTKPILPGVMPVLNPESVHRFADMNGARVPPLLWGRLEVASPADRLAIAVEQASEMSALLLAEGAPGIHLYSLNRSEAIVQIANNVGLR